MAGREGLLALLQRAPDGTRLGDLRDAYPGAADDAAALAAEGQAWLLPGGETFDAVAFPRPPAPMPMSDEVAAAWHQTEARLAAMLCVAVPAVCVLSVLRGMRRGSPVRKGVLLFLSVWTGNDVQHHPAGTARTQ